MILQSAQNLPVTVWVWGIVLGASFITVLGCARAGSLLLWNVDSASPGAEPARPAQWLPLATLLGGGALLVAFAAPVQRYADATAAQIVAREGYVSAVIGATAERAPRPLPGGSGR